MEAWDDLQLEQWFGLKACSTLAPYITIASAPCAQAHAKTLSSVEETKFLSLSLFTQEFQESHHLDSDGLSPKRPQHYHDLPLEDTFERSKLETLHLN